MDLIIYKSLKKSKDEKGALTELLQERDKRFIRFFYATIGPNKIRGNHYHRSLDEWLIAIDSKIKLIVEDITTKKRKEIILSPSSNGIPKVRIGVNLAHAVKNISKKDAVIIGYMAKAYNHKSSGAYEYKRYNII